MTVLQETLRMMALATALTAGLAQGQELTIVLEPDDAGLLRAAPEAMAKRLRSAPEAFLRNAARLIHGYGTADGINAAGIEGFIAQKRARVRARSITPLLAADLNDDGRIGREEMLAVAATLAANARGDLRIDFDHADTSRDGALTLDELRAFGQTRAMAELTEEEVLRLMGLLVFDSDANGWTTMPEVEDGVRRILDDA